MAHDMARVIVAEAAKMLEQNTLRVELNFCMMMDRYFANVQDVTDEYCVIYMKSVPFLTRKAIEPLVFLLNDKGFVIYEGFTLVDFDDAMEHAMTNYFLELSHSRRPGILDTIHIRFTDSQTKNSVVRMLPLGAYRVDGDGMCKFNRKSVCEAVVKSVNNVSSGWNMTV